MKLLGLVVLGIYLASTTWLLITAFAQLHLLYLAKKQKSLFRKSIGVLPFVTIQLPVYNEKYVIDDLLHSISQLDYPKHLFEIQILDDSTDETSAIIDQISSRLKSEGYDLSVLRRTDRKEFKAGALQYGLQYAKGDLIAIFDADFRPAPKFLKEMTPHFQHAKVGLVQAKWGHLNKEQNFLTRIQTYLLDMHFLVEQAGRYNADYFINFCGTAGIWRRQCIVDAGGWDGKVLSEDLDLSYRAQLKGWKIVYDKTVEVKAQLPSVIEAFKIQQFRWTKGMAQTAKKTLHAVWHMQLPPLKKMHSMFHLLGSFTFVCLFINALLTVPLLLLRNYYSGFVQLTNYTAIGVLNLGALAFLYYKSCTTEQKSIGKFLLNYPLFMVVYLAMSIQNTIAVLQGVFGMRTPFVRTPKFNDNKQADNSYVNKKKSWLNYLELGLLVYFIAGIGLSLWLKDYFMIMFFLMISTGLSILLYHSFSVSKWKDLFNLQLQFKSATVKLIK